MQVNGFKLPTFPAPLGMQMFLPTDHLVSVRMKSPAATNTTSSFGEASMMHTGNQINQALGDCLLAGLM